MIVIKGASLVALRLNCLPAMQETRVRSLGREDPLGQEDPLKEIGTHSSILVWRIPWTEEPGRLRSMGLLRVKYDSATSLSLSRILRVFPDGASGKESACQCRRCKRCRFDPWVGKIPWKTAWQPTPVFLPGESRGQKSLAGYSP